MTTAQGKGFLLMLSAVGLFVATVALFALFCSVELGLRAPFIHEASVISVGAAVPANAYNTLAEELKRKEAELREREAALRAEQSATPPSSREHTPLLAVSIASTVLLFLLLLLHVYVDWRREQRKRPSNVFAPHLGIHEGELQTRL